MLLIEPDNEGCIRLGCLRRTNRHTERRGTGIRSTSVLGGPVLTCCGCRESAGVDEFWDTCRLSPQSGLLAQEFNEQFALMQVKDPAAVAVECQRRPKVKFEAVLVVGRGFFAIMCVFFRVWPIIKSG
jgi:hypothetical protein